MIYNKAKSERMKIPFLAIIASILLVLLFRGASSILAQDQQTPIWQAADGIRSTLLDAQRELFSAGRADNPGEHYQTAAAYVADALAMYENVLQADILLHTSSSDMTIREVFAAAADAAARGDGVALALARGRIWTHLLSASYETTLGALSGGDVDTAESWLSFREYRQATRVTIILSPAANALTDLRAGEITVDDAYTIVQHDLRDAYYFRLRQALSELETALEEDFFIRSAEWLGQIDGYFAIFSEDYVAQVGTDVPQAVLNDIASAVLVQDTTAALTGVDTLRDSLTAYQPVALTSAQIAERGQLLYIFIDLVHIEYKDGVRDGEITIPIEYQEANTFLAQARSTFDELRPTIAAQDLNRADRLDIILIELQGVLDELGEVALVRELVEEGKGIISDTLPLGLENTTAAAFTIVATLLDDVERSVADERYQDAENTRLQAYAMFDFGPEQRLLAFAPNLAFEIDALFWHGDSNNSGLARVIAARGSIEDFQAVRSQLDASLEEAQIILGASTQPLTIIVNSAIIVFREGLEAVVIIAALSAGMVRVNKAYRRPLFTGAFGAFVATGLTWVIADAFLSLFRDYGERLEAVVSMIALGVLLLITNWFFHKVYWTDHLAGFHQRKGQLLRGEAGKYLGLMILGFTSIYREGFETVLFLQALVLDAGVLIVIQGVLLGLVGVGIVGFITFRMQKHLPYMQMMIVTGILIGAVLIMLMGNTVRVMQVVGWVSVHPIDGVNFPYWWGQWFGVYPTWEGIVAQIGAAAFVIGSYYLAECQSAHKRRQRSRSRQSVINGHTPEHSSEAPVSE
jgi:high-affinity iron transporter